MPHVQGTRLDHTIFAWEKGPARLHSMEAAIRPYRLLRGRLTTARVSVSVTSFDVCTDLAAPRDHPVSLRSYGERLEREPEQVPGLHLAIGEGPRGGEEREDGI
jgi:hypothetical protein